MATTLLGRFTFDTTLSHRDGGQGEIFKGYDIDLDRHVAVKRIYLADALSKSSFKKEVEALARLKHDNIIKIIDIQIMSRF
jgi:serine/threonine protein kinase